MKKIIENNKKKIITFLIIFSATLIIFMPFLQKHYTTDSYNISSIGYKEYAIKNSLNDGRVLMAFIGYTADLMKIPLDMYIISLTIMALFVNCISVIFLKEWILKIKKNKNFFSELFVTIVSYFTIFNFMYIENMVFIECFVMSLSILFYILAAKKIILNKSNFMKAVVLTILGLFCYQGTISVYFVVLVLFSLLKNEKYDECRNNLTRGVLILIFGIILQFIAIRFFGKIFNMQQDRLSEFDDIAINIMYSFYYLGYILINTGYVYTKYLFIFFLSIIEILIVFKIYKEKLDNKILINTILIIIICFFSGIAISFISTTGFWSARIRFSIGATIGFLIIYLYCKTDIAFTFKKINLLIISIFAIYTLSIVINYISIMNNTLKVNLQDKLYAIEIINYIKKYENENNITVNKLAIFRGRFKDDKACYKNLNYYGATMSWSAVRTQWSIKGVLEMYSNKHFTVIEPDENDLEYYLNNVDIAIDYMCIKDTLYISYYVY